MVKRVPVTAAVYSGTAPGRSRPLPFPGLSSFSQPAYTDFGGGERDLPFAVGKSHHVFGT